VTPELCARYEALLAGIGFRNSMGLNVGALAEMEAIRESELRYVVGAEGRGPFKGSAGSFAAPRVKKLGVDAEVAPEGQALSGGPWQGSTLC
jgi:hypothetical protein